MRPSTPRRAAAVAVRSPGPRAQAQSAEVVASCLDRARTPCRASTPPTSSRTRTRRRDCATGRSPPRRRPARARRSRGRRARGQSSLPMIAGGSTAASTRVHRGSTRRSRERSRIVGRRTTRRRSPRTRAPRRWGALTALCVRASTAALYSQPPPGACGTRDVHGWPRQVQGHPDGLSADLYSVSQAYPRHPRAQLSLKVLPAQDSTPWSRFFGVNPRRAAGVTHGTSGLAGGNSPRPGAQPDTSDIYGGGHPVVSRCHRHQRPGWLLVLTACRVYGGARLGLSAVLRSAGGQTPRWQTRTPGSHADTTGNADSGSGSVLICGE